MPIRSRHIPIPAVMGAPNHYTADFSTMSDGALPSQFQGAGTAAIASGKAVLTPTLEANMPQDPGFETWASATDLTYWSETKAGTSAIGQESTVINSDGGSYAVRLDVDGSNSEATLGMLNRITTAHRFYQFSVYARSAAGAPSFALGNPGSPDPIVITLDTTYKNYVSAWCALLGQGIIIKRSNATSLTGYFDTATIKPITTNTMYRVVHLSKQNVIAWAATNGTSDNIRGVVAHLDNLTTPQNGLFAYGGMNIIRLLKFVGGVFTPLIGVAYSPIDGAIIKIVQNGTTAQLWYNGQQVGTDQTIDASILTGTYHGIFSSSPDCSFNSFGVRQYA